MISFRDKTFCRATECANWSNCRDAYTEGVEFLATESHLPVLFYSNPRALKCYRPAIDSDESVVIIGQPKTRKAAAALYGADFDPTRCIRAVEGQGTFWQCGHKAGKGSRGLYCGRHS